MNASVDDQGAGALRRIISLLLQGIGLHAVEGDRTDFDRFRADLDQIQASAGDAASPDQMLVAAGGAIQALKDYNQRSSRYLRLQSAELQNMVSMLTQTVVTIGSGSQQSVQRLQEIAKQLERTSAIDDVHKLKLRMTECLDTVREEATRQKTEGTKLTQSLRVEVERSQKRITAIHNPELDSCTGLPQRGAAELCFQEAVESPGAKYVLTAVVQRIHAINTRYGYALGDRVLDSMCQHFLGHLAKTDRMFRWNGPAVVALLSREHSLDHVRGEIRRFAEERLEKTFEVGGRSVMIRISPGWSVVPLAATFAEVSPQIDAFVATQHPADAE
jgi:GGDEF domain-containing protein